MPIPYTPSPIPYLSHAPPFGGYGSSSPIDNTPLYKMPLDYYTGLFTSQYKQYTGTDGNLLDWAKDSWKPIDDLTNCVQQMSQQLSLLNASGVQLDLIGELLNMPRQLPFQPSGGVSPILDDVTYLMLLKATIYKYHWNGKTVSLYAIWKNLFVGGSIIINDNQNMTCDIILTGSFNSITVDLIEQGYIVPRPEGVLYNYTYGTLPLFGCDLNNTYVAGVDLGHIA